MSSNNNNQQQDTTTAEPTLVPTNLPYDDDDDDDDMGNLPPGRIHATRGPARLTSSFTSSNNSNNLHYSPGRSRSRSPGVTHKSANNTVLTADGNSSISSLEDIVDTDILYDRQGLTGDLAAVQKLHNSREFGLPSVNERASDDTLEDCHAFSSNVVYSSNASRVSQDQTFLDPLVEGEEETELDDIQEETTVILTNMENLALSDDPVVRGGGASTNAGSLMARDGTRAESSIFGDSLA